MFKTGDGEEKVLMESTRPIKIKRQPDDVTCGPTCLHAVYRYYGDKISLKKVIEGVSYLEGGGTLGALLGIHALKRGYTAKIYTFNLDVFDPTWFSLPAETIKYKIAEQLKYKKGKRLAHASSAYQEFISNGGELHFENLTFSLLKRFLINRTPILTGLSATYLYNTSREYTDRNNQSVYDDIRGHPAGHFVILWGYNKTTMMVDVADPFKNNPLAGNSHYSVQAETLINAIMLGILTYDANVLIIEPKEYNYA